MTEQAPRVVFVATTRRRKDLEYGPSIFKFVKLSKKRFFGFKEEEMAGARFKVSSREKTVLDCLMYPRYCGGLDEVVKGIWEAKDELEQRINEYKGRPDLKAPVIQAAPIKEPKSEAETALLLQAMISSKHPGIDFRIWECKTSIGTDLLVERVNKGIHTFAWTEMLVKLEHLFTWPHNLDGIHKIVAWELGNVNETMPLPDGRSAKFMKRGNGRYLLDNGTDTVYVYVLREIIQEYKT